VARKPKHQNDELVSKALGFLKSHEVKNKDVQTDFISIEPTYDSNISRTKPLTYIVRKSIDQAAIGAGEAAVRCFEMQSRTLGHHPR
jgi:uncharacterized protein YggE